MAKAISQIHSPDGSALGSFFAELVDIGRMFPNGSAGLTGKDRLLAHYKDDLIRRANSSLEWNKYSEYLKVEIVNNRISVSVSGPDYIERLASLLEYGTGDTVAVPLMRVAEAEYNEDFATKRMYKL
jgi:hypothetical protein